MTHMKFIFKKSLATNATKRWPRHFRWRKQAAKGQKLNALNRCQRRELLSLIPNCQRVEKRNVSICRVQLRCEKPSCSKCNCLYAESDEIASQSPLCSLSGVESFKIASVMLNCEREPRRDEERLKVKAPIVYLKILKINQGMFCHWLRKGAVVRFGFQIISEHPPIKHPECRIVTTRRMLTTKLQTSIEAQLAVSVGRVIRVLCLDSCVHLDKNARMKLLVHGKHIFALKNHLNI
ncbi:hypothetical protein M514_01097 [Trichuris suis]|uniref:Uncharacterized protein n=1 Tax=Trichuris suis TaxID=68888 RepID=A0A085MZD4_9BILA|nr:hypothetical protein M513_01097 [Trichuris suis]KFD62580.1 hypothetical protein M514_01097 [Trichuris suis]